MHVLIIPACTIDEGFYFNWDVDLTKLPPFPVLMMTREYVYLSLTEEELLMFKLSDTSAWPGYQHTTSLEYHDFHSAATLCDYPEYTPPTETEV